MRQWACRACHHQALHEEAAGFQKIKGVTHELHLPAMRGVGAIPHVEAKQKRLCRARAAQSIFGPQGKCTSCWLLGNQQSFNSM